MFTELVLLFLVAWACGQDLKLSETVNVAEFMKDEVDLDDILLPSDHSDIAVSADTIEDASLSSDAISSDAMVDTSSSSELLKEEMDALLSSDHEEAIIDILMASDALSSVHHDVLRDDSEQDAVHDINDIIFNENYGSPDEFLDQCIAENAFISQLNQEKLELFDTNIKLSVSNQQFNDVLKKYNITDPSALDSVLSAMGTAPTQAVTDNNQGPICDACPVLDCPASETCPVHELPIIPLSNALSGCGDLVQQNELLKDKLETYEIKVKLSKNDQAMAEANYQNCFLQSEANLLELKYNEKKLRSQIGVCEDELSSLSRKVGSSVEYREETVTKEKAAEHKVKGIGAIPVAKDNNESVPLSSTEQVSNMIKTSLSYMNSTINSILVDEIRESGAIFVGYTLPIILSFFNNMLKLYIYYMTYMIGSVIIPAIISLYVVYLLPLYNQHLSATVTQAITVISEYYNIYVRLAVLSITANEYFVLYVMPAVVVITESSAKSIATVTSAYTERSSDEISSFVYDFIVKGMSLLYEFTSHYVLELIRLILDSHVFDDYTGLFAYTSVSLLILVAFILARRFIFGVILLFFIILLAPLFLITYIPMKALTSIWKIVKKIFRPTKKGKRKSASVDAEIRPKEVDKRNDRPPSAATTSNNNVPINEPMKGPAQTITSALPAYSDSNLSNQSQLGYKLSP